MRRALPLMVLLALAWGGSALAVSEEVTVRDNSFSPSTITITEGMTIRWSDVGNNPHSVTADTGGFDSHPNCTAVAPALCMQNGSSFSHVFNTAGTYAYHCRVHGPAGMTGTVVVEPAPPPTAAATPRIDTPRPTARRTATPNGSATPGSSPTPTVFRPTLAALASPTPFAVGNTRGAGLPPALWILIILGILTGGAFMLRRVLREP